MFFLYYRILSHFLSFRYVIFPPNQLISCVFSLPFVALGVIYPRNVWSVAADESVIGVCVSVMQGIRWRPVAAARRVVFTGT